MRSSLVAFLLLLTATVPAAAQLSIGITIGAYPNFMSVPGYPVYYAPDVGGNYFFYDGLYWVYQDDNWYSSSWYNGPWDSVDPMYVPVFILQIPVRYYRRPPQYFGGWQSDRPPRWNDHWGRDWAQRRQDWDQPRREANSTPAPLPDYQRRYSGKDYPRADQQQVLKQQNYRYQTQGASTSQDSGKQADERQSGSVQRNVQPQPTRDTSNANRTQSQPAPQQDRPEQQVRRAPQQGRPQQDRPQQQARPAPQQDRPQQQARPAPQQDRQQPATPKAEQPRAPAGRETGNAGPGAVARKAPDSDHNPGQKPRNDQSGGADKKQDQDHKQD